MVDIRQWSRLGHDKAKLVSIDPRAPGMVLFDFNPNKIHFSRHVITTGYGTDTATSGKQLVKSEPGTIRITEIILQGADTKNRCDQLLYWTSQPTGMLAEMASGLMDLKVKLPELTFQWGPPMVGFFYQVFMKSCEISYERFGDNGEPSRARVNLTLEEQPSLLGRLPTNPTSGGLAGRRAHQMHQGENLVNVANQQLGHPQHWRALAEANRLDDPLRIKPGTSIFVPSPRELEQRRGR
ncbi:hypothetical protein [Streptomyces sp. NPDC047028]|uniref:CIS tube protein n=1 Tax=Streptomyces sp. NPDC047028 TaxID=3155793 RepID=UPI0034099F23